MDEILQMLAGAESLSGEAIGAQLGITRAAVWKRIQGLRAQGYDIRGVGKGGYRLAPPIDTLQPLFWQHRLRTSWAGHEAHFLAEVDSTNAEAKRLALEGAPHGLLVLADRQTAGRGRRGRGWESPPGMGLWMTLLVRPVVQAERIPSLALAVALAVTEACEKVCGVQVGLKWPNDAVVDGKKICGILLEMAADLDGAQWVVIGIGLNVRQQRDDFPPELEGSATSLALESPGGDWQRADLLLALLGALETQYHAWETGGVAALREAYVRRSITLNQTVRVIQPTDEFIGQALGIDDTGALMVRREDGAVCRVLAADVSVRGAHGYVG